MSRSKGNKKEKYYHVGLILNNARGIYKIQREFNINREMIFNGIKIL